MRRQDLLSYLDQELNVGNIKDYCPNGLQVEGRAEVTRIVTGVTASQRLIDKAIALRADALIVHHGYFWKGEKQPIVGIKKQRIAALLAHDINLIAYHLPIDVHALWGNNARLGALLHFASVMPMPNVSPSGIVYQGCMEGTLLSLVNNLKSVLNRKDVLVEGELSQPIKTVAWCSGGGQSYIEQAAEAGVDAFFSGEVSEQTIHLAREMNIAFIAAGHHATERYGVQALGKHLAREFDLDVSFIDIPNPA